MNQDDDDGHRSQRPGDRELESTHDDALEDPDHDFEARPVGKRTLTETLRPRRSSRAKPSAPAEIEAKAESGDDPPAADPDAMPYDLGDDAELSAWTSGQVHSAVDDSMADLHTCFAGCMHSQFDRVMAAADHTLTFEPGAVEEAVARHKAAQAAGQAAPGAGQTAQPGPAAAGNANPGPGAGNRPPAAAPATQSPVAAAAVAAASAGHEMAYAGSVSDGIPGGFPGLFGLATWSYGAFKYPELTVTARASEGIEEDGVPADQFIAEVATTTSADAPSSAISTPAGTHAAGVSSVTIDGVDTQVTATVVVDAAAAAQIRVAEQEHLDDVTFAYNLTLKAAEDAVNAAAAYSLPRYAASKAEAIKIAKDQVKDALDPKLKADSANWRAMMKTVGELTRSGRDKSGWHTFDAKAASDDIDVANKTAIFRVKPNANVGSHPSSEIIKL